jgi:hypothetical protein
MATRKPPHAPATPAPPKPTHLAASMRVVASHLHMRHVSVAAAKAEVLRAAELVAAGTDLPENARLVATLEKVTGASIAELAVFADDWPDEKPRV